MLVVTKVMHLTIAESQVQNSLKPQDKPYTTSLDSKFIVVNETPPDPDLWVVLTCISGKLSIFPGNKENILKPHDWHVDKEITVAQVLLKQNFPLLMVLKPLQLLALLSHLHFLSLFKLSTQEITGFNLSTVGCAFGHVNV